MPILVLDLRSQTSKVGALPIHAVCKKFGMVLSFVRFGVKVSHTRLLKL